MIVDAIVQILVALLTGIFGLLPAWSINTTAIQALGSSAGDAVSAVNGVFPVTTLGVCITIAVGVRMFIAAWSIVVWLYDKFPFKAT